MSILTSTHWIIASSRRGPSSSPAEHTSESSAIREAERLALADPSDTFLIYQATHSVAAPRVVTTDLRTGDDVPF